MTSDSFGGRFDVLKRDRHAKPVKPPKQKSIVGQGRMMIGLESLGMADELFGGMTLNFRRWFREHSLKLLAIRDTPNAIAGGVAIGIFFGFLPLFGIKTLSAIFFAWLTGSNLIAAVLAATMHDIFLPLMPMIYRWEYSLGYWILSTPHHWPTPLTKINWGDHSWWTWTTFLTVGRPLLLGSVLFALPWALGSYFAARAIVSRHQQKKAQAVN
jgi:uncharacterized protein (DUF2062 family)